MIGARLLRAEGEGATFLETGWLLISDTCNLLLNLSRCSPESFAKRINDNVSLGTCDQAQNAGMHQADALGASDCKDQGQVNDTI